MVCRVTSMAIICRDDRWFAGWQVWQSCAGMTAGLLGDKYGNTVDG